MTSLAPENVTVDDITVENVAVETVTVRWTDDAERLILTIPRTRLESHLAVGHPGAAPAREQLETFVMTQVLPAVRSSCTDLLEGSRTRSSRLAPVLSHLQTHADEPLTPEDLARVGCMSVRTLHATFQQELGMSPMAYLRRVRLDHVHAELLRSPPASTRISDVAVRWGFFHPSRFARQYHERFGELPSQTARRSTAATARLADSRGQAADESEGLA